MKNTVIIKIFSNDITCSAYHDMKLDEFDLKVKELKNFAESIGKNIYFTVCNASNCANFDCFAEITYNGSLSEQEKEKYVSVVKFFAQDADTINKSMNIYDLPLSIIFTKAQIETL